MIELLDNGCHFGTVRDFVEFFLQPFIIIRQERLASIGVDLRGCIAEDMRQLVAIFHSGRSRSRRILETSRRILETIEKIEFFQELYHFRMDDDVLRHLCRLLENLPLTMSKVALPISMNPITETFDWGQSMQLITSVATNSHLKEVQLRLFHVDTEVARVLANDLIPRNPLEVLRLEGCGLGNYNEGCSLLLRAALDGETSTIRDLKLSENQITVLDVEAIELLKTNTRLQTLNLFSNFFGDAGAALIAEALTVNQSLTTLVLSNCSIGNDGCAALGTALQVNQSLKELDMYRNDFGDDGLRSLALGLRSNRSLEHLNIPCCLSITEGGVRHLVELVQRYRMLPALQIILEGSFTEARFPREASLIHSASEFNRRFIESCRRLLLVKEKESTATRATSTTTDNDNHDEVIRHLLPLLIESTHSLIQPSVLFLLARRCPEACAQASLSSPTTRNDDDETCIRSSE